MAEEPIRKEDIIDSESIIKGILDIVEVLKNQLIPAIDGVKKSATEELAAINKLNPALKEHQNIISQKTQSITKLDREQKEYTKTLTSTEKLEKQLQAALSDTAIIDEKLRKQIIERKKANKESIEMEGLAEGSLAKLRKELAALKKAYTEASPDNRDGILEGLKKTDGEVRKLENSMGVFSRNVGNYPKTLGEAKDAFKDLASTIGNVFGGSVDTAIELLQQLASSVSASSENEVSQASESFDELSTTVSDTAEQAATAATEFFTVGGVVGVLSTAVGLLAAAWKNTRENIELYLKSADKLGAGIGAFEQDASKAREDSVKRAKGQAIEGARLAKEYSTKGIMWAKELTEEEKKHFDAMVRSRLADGENGREIYSQTLTQRGKLEWERKYIQLLIEQEKINDEKLLKAEQFEKLESDLAKQRSIVSDAESTKAQKDAASMEAERIITELVKEKGLFIERQLVNIEAISQMTATQEVNEDAIAALKKEQQTASREYYLDQLKIDKLNRSINKEIKSDNRDLKKEREEIATAIVEEASVVALTKDEWEEATLAQLSYIYNLEKLRDEEMAVINKEESPSDKLAKDLAKTLPTFEQNQAALAQIHEDSVNKQKKADQELYEQKMHNLSQVLAFGTQVASILADQMEKQKQRELSAAGDNAVAREKIEREYFKKQKALNIAQAIMNGALAVTNILATVPLRPLNPAAWIGIGIAAAQTAIQLAVISAQKFAEGGEIKGKLHSQGGTMVEAEGGEYIVKRKSTSKYKGLIEAINEDNPMRIAEELRNKNFHTVWGGVSEQLSHISRQDPYTRMMYELMKNDIKTYTDTNGDTVLTYPDGSKRVIRKYMA